MSKKKKKRPAVKKLPNTAPTTFQSAGNPSNTKLYLVLSFFLPFLLLGTAYAVNGVYPFGDKQILVTDLWQQYYPFLSDFQAKLQEGSSLLYSWDTGMGSNFVALSAYYLASPLNFFTLFIPQAFLREALTVFLLIRIGCSGLFCAIFLKSIFKRNDITLPFFSVLYALCAYTMGYYWNIIWFDSFALLPLVVLGTVALVREGKYKLYVISLALAVLTNYYMGFFICIFTAIVFFGVCICSKLSLKAFFKKLLSIAGFTAISLSLTAFVTLPAYLNLQLTYSAENTFPSPWKFENSFVDLFGNFAAFVPPNVKEGLPNIYCGFLCIMLAVVFLLSKKISLREKILHVSVLAFLLISCNVNVLNFIWHGFHSTNMIPYRFSFLISFILVVMAYRAFTLLEDITLVDICGMAIAATFVIVCAAIGQQDDTAVYGSIVLAVIFLFVLFLYERKLFNKKAVTGIICGVILVEMCFNVMIGVNEVRVTDHTNYPDQFDKVQSALDTLEETDDEAFYRVEFSAFYTLNDPPLYGYTGVSQFASTANVNVTNFLEGIGLLGWDAGNRYYYAETSPLTNAFVDLKYLIAKNGYLADTVNWSQTFDTDGMKTYKNNRYLSLGFMTEKNLQTFLPNKADPFAAQQELFEKATGITDALFTPVSVLNVGHSNLNVYYDQEGVYGQYNYRPQDTAQSSSLKWNYEMPEDGVLYVYAKIDNTENILVSNDQNGSQHWYNIKRPYIFSAGKYNKGDIVSFFSNTTTGYSGNADIYVCVLNQDVFDRGYELLNDEKLEITNLTATQVDGTITAKKDGLMYTSIPYEEGWTAYVDGVETEIIPIANAMCAVPLSQGEHQVTFKYSPNGFIPGVLLGVAALALFILIIAMEQVYKKKRKKMQADPVTATIDTKQV